ncbi:ARG28 factor, partial [Centropus unirufus]|nr:ARG28 factor [Centropus unirufus]
GWVTINAKSDQCVYQCVLSEDAELYSVYDGSLRSQIMFAERVSDNTLWSIVPAHGCQEVVSVSVLMYTRGQSPVSLSSCPVTYTANLSCKLSCFLVSHAECIAAASHKIFRGKFGSRITDLRSLGNYLVVAVAHELASTWNIIRNCSEGGMVLFEAMLEEYRKLAAVVFSLYLSVEHLLWSKEHVVAVSRAVLDISRVEISEGVCVQFVNSSGALLLSRTAQHLLESDIKLFRKYTWDRPLLYQIGMCEAQELITHIMSQISWHIFKNFFFFPEQRHSTLDILRKLKTPPTFFAATRLSAMLSGSDEVYVNCMVVDQAGDLKTNYIHGDGVSSEKCLNPTNSVPVAKSSSSPSLENDHCVYVPDEGNQRPVKNEKDAGLSRTISPSDPYGADSYLPFKTHGFIKDGGQLHADMRKRSSSLDDLEVDGGSGHVPDVSHVHCAPLGSSEMTACSRDGLDFSTSLQPKECTVSGTRSRSYSCSSPKGLLGRPRIPCDFAAGDLNEGHVLTNSGRSLLQALSRSKSLSLLHPRKRAYSLPEQSREKRFQEEEWNKYIVPSKNESEKCKVSRTFSFLVNRMTSTRNKCKTKNKDAKDKEKQYRHNFTNGTFSGVTPCMACEKALLGKESLQCSHCNIIVHKNCKECAPVCAKVTSYTRHHNRNKPQAGVTNSLPGDVSQTVLFPVHSTSSVPIGLSAGKREASQQSHFLSKSVPGASFERRSTVFYEQDSESTSWGSRSRSEEMLQALGTFSSMDTFMMEDDVDLPQWTDLRTDAQEFEAESWSLAVDPVFCSKQEKDVIKRQDVIFELMQTEVHHIYTLFIMSEIFRRGMKEELQLDHSTVDRIFPCLDELVDMHRQFFCRMKERRQESCEAENERNFVISRIGDILVQQFSEENATKMKEVYGEFCSHQKEAVNLFKELQQNKKFQNFIKLRNSNLLARRRGIPECILLVTQRITKYPVLVERILQYTKEGTEHKDLCKALLLIKDMIAAVDMKVNEYEKKQKLLEILSRTENKTYTKLKNGHAFRKQDLMKKERILLHEGLVYWKTATGRFKDTLSLLLTDVLVFLQEKDQKYIFAAVDQKPSVISLQRLIVREVANEERGMFLISASSAGPEMYEVHTNSKEERNNWMRHIQDAVESCPEEGEGKMSESDEDKRIAEAKASRIQKWQESLSNQDQQICSYLEEKLRIYAELGDMSGFEDVHVEPHLLVKPDSGETPQAASLVAAALREVESLHVAVTSQLSELDRSPEESIEASSVKHGCSANEILESDPGDAEIKEESSEADLIVEKKMAGDNLEDKGGSLNFPGSTGKGIVQAIQNLTRLLYSVQATVVIQDSHRELHQLLLQENEKTSRAHGSRLNLLLEQEKYRNLEKQRVELVNVHKLEQQFQQEQQQWMREWDQRERDQEARRDQLRQRERECGCQEELLERSRQVLALQMQEYQQSLERLQEGQKMVERERDSVKMQKKLLWHWKHGQQSNLLSSRRTYEIMGRNQSDSLHDENKFCLNDTVVCVSLSSLNRSDSSLVYEDGVYGLNISNSDIARTSENQMDLKRDTSCQTTLTSTLWKSTDPYQQMYFSYKSNEDAFNNDLNASETQGPQTSIPNQESIQAPQIKAPQLNHQPESQQDAESGDRVEEKIVYL